MFGDKLRALMDSHGYTPAEMERLTGINRAVISNLLRKRNKPTWRTVQLVALALKVPATDLMDDDVRLPAYRPGRPYKRKG
jgi:transcriptional regulator with XRE-family HTH domain